VAQTVQDKEPKTEHDEITFADVVRFVRRNWKLLALLTVLLSVISVALVLLLPRQYQKDVALSVGLGPSELRVMAEGMALPTPEQIGSSAASSLQGEALPEVRVNPTYDAPTNQIKVALSSPDMGALEGATPQLVALLEPGLSRRYEGEFDDVLEMQLIRAEREVEVKSNALDSIEQRTQEASSEDELGALVGQRESVLSAIAEEEAKREDLEQAREDLSQVIADSLAIEVVSESAVRQARPPAALVLLAVVGSLAGAIALTLAREVLARRK
jgi:hypothetical protein